MADDIAFHLFREHSRVTSVQEVTDTSVYKEGEVPSNKESLMTVEVVHAVTMVDAAGRLLVLEFDQPEALDRNEATGGPIERDGEEIKAGSGAATIQVTKLSTIIDPVLKSKADKMLGVMENAPGGR